MNKLLLIAFMLFFGFALNAQKMTTSVQSPKHSDLEFDNGIAPSLQKRSKIKSTKGTAEGWFHHPSAISFLNTKDLADFPYTSFYLFKDTTINIYYSSDDELEPVWWLAAANVTDPADEIYDYMNVDPDVDEFNQYSVYTLDSLGLNALYIRNSADTIVDTLVIIVQKQVTTFQDINYNGDVIHGLPWIYHDLHKWNTTTAGSPNANILATIKIPLDSTMESRDSIMPDGEVNYFFRYFQFYMDDIASETFTSGSVPEISISFIPGYEYTPNVDTLFGAVNNKFNSFRILTYKLNANSAQTYNSEHSCSYFFSRQFARGSSQSTGYMPFYLYMMDGNSPDFRYEYFDISYYFSTTNDVSINEESSESNLSVAQNQPNPFNGSTTINYTLNKSSNVSLDIYNVAGDKVMTVNQGIETAGSHKVQINAEDLNAGIYFYTLTADGYSVTKKMIVY
jgi:hypothetical protein